MNLEVHGRDLPISIGRAGTLISLERASERARARADSAAEAKELVDRLIFWATVGDPFGSASGAPWDLHALLRHVDAEHQAARQHARRRANGARYRIGGG